MGSVRPDNVQVPSANQPMGGGSTADGLLGVNDLRYKLKPDLSVTVNKTHKTHNFQSNVYNDGQRAISIFNSGADYINTHESWLEFKVSIDGPENHAVSGYFGKNGSALNFIQSITISTRSGDEISRIDDLALLSNMCNPFKYSDRWKKNQGKLMGLGGFVNSPDIIKKSRTIQGNYVTAANYAVVHDNSIGFYPIKDRTGTEQGTAAVGENVFCIPLYLLSPFFGYGRLMPAMLMSGLRVEIEWAKKEKAMTLFAPNVNTSTAVNSLAYEAAVKDALNTVTGYTITRPTFVLSSCQLSDSIQRGLNEVSATNGLEIVYTDMERTQIYSASATDTYHLEVRKSCSRALTAIARVQCETANLRKDLVDSNAGEQNFPYVRYQWQLGSLYFPHQAVKAESKTTPLTMAKQTFAHTLCAFQKFGKHDPDTYISFDGDAGERVLADGSEFQQRARFGGNTNQQKALEWAASSMQPSVPGQTLATAYGRMGSFCNDAHVVAVSLERSNLFDLAGVPVNNSRVLSLAMELISKENVRQYPKTEDDKVTAGELRRKLVVFLRYVKMARVFLNNVEVEQ